MRRSFLPLLLTLVLVACGRPPPPEPTRVAAALIARHGRPAVRETIELLGAALMPTDLPGWPDLRVRGDAPGATPLRKWFEARGIYLSYSMDSVLRQGVLELTDHPAPDWDALVAAELREYGPQVRLPILPDRDLSCDEYRRVRVTMDAAGAFFHRHERVPEETIREVLFKYAELQRDEKDPENRSEFSLLISGDRAAPYRLLHPLLAACRDPVVRICKVAFAYVLTDYDVQRRITVFLPSRPVGPSAPVLHVTTGAAPAPPADPEAPVVLRIDDDVPLQRVAEVLYALVASGHENVDFEDAGAQGK